IKYYNVMFSGLLINVAWMFILVEVFKLWYMASVVIVSAGLMFYNFFLHKYWSFRGLNNKHKKDNKSR
nr:GtrA family protein [Microcystis aeruginosa G13-03]